MQPNHESLDTKLIHAGEPSPRVDGAVAMPVFQTAMFEYAGEADYHALRYIRINNTPNHEVLHAKLAALENAEAALLGRRQVQAQLGLGRPRGEDRQRAAGEGGVVALGVPPARVGTAGCRRGSGRLQDRVIARAPCGRA